MLELEQPDPSRAHRRRLAGQGEAGRHPIASVTEVIDLDAAAAPHAQRFDTVGRTKGGASATSSRWQPP